MAVPGLTLDIYVLADVDDAGLMLNVAVLLPVSGLVEVILL